ncbi:tRNA pseudouridine(38-40) synthase TruA [Sporolactobacillus laevolacticus]|uniref:tRNA pseudouridine(38-40) synthase TruA n=1 Tax=Sporolactobacillus laevolacticus TaxID=33018 RepID=UPI0025B4F7DC|nr:tRNA pseudouridine(38-40) synthase TruA [Sporolactobacillus laevolacticus]MDN3956741.1 tRNA pseudouridine(38-40) synthase TruA [Sporolactobacillus laevolacticus]
MTKMKCTVAYDGSQFFGYQVQPGKRTVQSEIQEALARMHHGQPVKISASGRTDRGVHAYGQVFHFETHLNIPEERWPLALNSLLPNDIYIRDAEEVPEQFHARYDVKKKEYRYRLLTRMEPDLFRRMYTTQVKETLDLDRMNQAAGAIIGTHDFTCFCAANTDVKDKVRTVYQLSVQHEVEDEIVLRIVGSGFLYQMVRIITGTLLDVGTHKIAPERVAEIIAGRDRQAASATAPAQGLTLWKVSY